MKVRNVIVLIFVSVLILSVLFGVLSVNSARINKEKIMSSHNTTKEELSEILFDNYDLFDDMVQNVKDMNVVSGAKNNSVIIEDMSVELIRPLFRGKIMITNAEKESKKSVDLRLAKEILVNLEFSRITVSKGCVRFFYRTYFTTEGSLLYSEDIDNSEYANKDAYTIEPIDKNWYYCVPY